MIIYNCKTLNRMIYTVNTNINFQQEEGGNGESNGQGNKKKHTKDKQLYTRGYFEYNLNNKAKKSQ